MRNRTRKLFVFVAVLLASVQLKAQEIKEELGAFRELKTFNGIEVTVVPSSENRIVINGHSKDKVKYDIVGDRLEVRLTLDNLWSKDNTTITVHGNNIETIDANEASIVDVKGVLKAPHLVFRAQEGAAINAEVNAEQVNSKAVSGGKIELSGKANKQDVEVNTAGQFLGRDLKTKHTTVSANTAGRGEVFANDYCKATAKIGGVVEVFGNPDQLDQKTSLGGKIL